MSAGASGVPQRWGLLVALAMGVAPLGAAALTFAPDTARAAEVGVINGKVRNSKTGESVAGALVLLQCSCIQGERETQTNADGLYSFTNLPAGSYTVQVLTGQADVAKTADLPRGAKFRVNFALDPENEFVRRIVVEPPVRSDSATVERVDMEAAANLPLPGRDMTDVVDISPTVQRDKAGLRLAGTGGDESRYQVDGANINNPSFGTVGATIVQEFISTVEVQEAGYDAEFGGASGGQVIARRVSGSNKVRGVALVRYTPRLALPRLIANTDGAVRASVVTDHQIQAVVTVSGPLIKDRLFFAAGISPDGNINSLIQSFYHRVDKDNSGGFAGCPYKNGDFDCAEGGNYIFTRKFAEQKFPTGRVGVGWFGRVDWVITPKHRLILSGGGGPGFDRTTYRLPSASVPNTFGTNPTASLGGLARVATGIVNDHFGWNFGNSTQVGLTYEGRVLRDTMEIDAGVSYFQARYQEAWRLDNPEQRDRPVIQEGDSSGRSLYRFLDRDRAINLVPGVEDACNASELPGQACPTRFWISGGIGQYNREFNRRVEGRANFTHFFNIVTTSHQLKYGLSFEHVSRDTVSAFSGSNAADFYENCPTEQIDGGGGEYCYDPTDDAYQINFGNRVNNNRIINVDSDSPNAYGTLGYGRVRREQGDLRAIATPLGSGIRAPFYDALLSTENYGAYLQDKMQLFPSLYLNAGVRWEIQSMRDINGKQALLIWDNVAPRLGLSYDWTEEGKSRLYASYGWFYRQLPLQLNSRAFGGLVQVNRSYDRNDCRGTVNINGVDNPMSIDGIPTEYCTDFGGGVSTSGLTEGAVVPRLKGQFNKQFQIGYEQEVVEDLLLGVRWVHNGLGRAVEDVSTNGGSSFIIANPGTAVSESDILAQEAICADLQQQLDQTAPDDPNGNVLIRELTRCNFLASAFDRVGTLFDKPSRDYDAWTFVVRKRFARNWILNASYSFSRLIGNYDGSVDRNTGAINIGASTQYDLPALVRNSFGPLFENRPHTIKVDGFYQFDLRDAGRLTLGTSFRYLSGTPLSILAASGISTAAIYVLPRGAGGTLPPVYTWNAQLGYAYPLPGELELEFNARLINLTNAKTPLRTVELYSTQSAHPVAGGDLGDLKHAKARGGALGRFYNRAPLVPQGNFGAEIAFQQPLSAQFELRLRF